MHHRWQSPDLPPGFRVEFLSTGAEVADPKFNACISWICGRTFFENGGHGTNAWASLSDGYNPIGVMTRSKGDLQHMVNCGVFITIFLDVIPANGKQ